MKFLTTSALVIGAAFAMVACGDSSGTGAAGAAGGAGGSGAAGGSGGSGAAGGVGPGPTTTNTGAGGSGPECGIIYDDRPECEACVEDNCCSELEGCAPGTDCDSLLVCATACAEGDQACVQACIDANGQGLEDLQTLNACFDASCANDPGCVYPICESGLVFPDQVCAECLSEPACCASATACAADQACLACLADPMTAGCDANALNLALVACFEDGDQCGPSCVTTICDTDLGYPNLPACNFCLGEAAADGGCCEATTACANNPACLDCLTGVTSGATCDNDALFTAFTACRTGSCDTECN